RPRRLRVYRRHMRQGPKSKAGVLVGALEGVDEGSRTDLLPPARSKLGLVLRAEEVAGEVERRRLEWTQLRWGELTRATRHGLRLAPRTASAPSSPPGLWNHPLHPEAPSSGEFGAEARVRTSGG